MADDFVSHLIVSGDKDQGIFTVQNQRPQSNRKKNTYCFSLHRLLWFCLLPPEKVADLGTCHMRFLTIDRFYQNRTCLKGQGTARKCHSSCTFPKYLTRVSWHSIMLIFYNLLAFWVCGIPSLLTVHPVFFSIIKVIYSIFIVYATVMSRSFENNQGFVFILTFQDFHFLAPSLILANTCWHFTLPSPRMSSWLRVDNYHADLTMFKRFCMIVGALSPQQRRKKQCC